MTKKDLKLFLSLIFWSLIPSIYLLIRMNIISINSIDINILGQMEWFDLIDEILITTLITPLYSILKPDKSSKFKNGITFIISFGIYFIFAIFISTYISQISSFMNAEYAAGYLRLQTISLLISFISTFMILLLTLNDNYKLINIITITKLLILIISDYLLISKYSDIGASYSEILTSTLIAIITIIITLKKELIAFGKIKLDFLKDWIKTGVFCGIQIFLDNFIYAIMICKMVNAVSESGNYWVANNFIWGWLLVPVSCMTEIIKKNKYEKLNFKNAWQPAVLITFLWLITMPLWNHFISKPMAQDANMILNIVFPLIPFYIGYIISSFIDGYFISKGKTIYNAINSFLVNIVYYGIAYILFNKGIFELNIMFIVLLFGFGMVFHLIISIILYIYERRKEEGNFVFILKNNK